MTTLTWLAGFSGDMSSHLLFRKYPYDWLGLHFSEISTNEKALAGWWAFLSGCLLDWLSTKHTEFHNIKEPVRKRGEFHNINDVIYWCENIQFYNIKLSDDTKNNVKTSTKSQSWPRKMEFPEL